MPWKVLCHEHLPNPEHSKLRERLMHLEDVHGPAMRKHFPPKEGSWAAKEARLSSVSLTFVESHCGGSLIAQLVISLSVHFNQQHLFLYATYFHTFRYGRRSSNLHDHACFLFLFFFCASCFHALSAVTLYHCPDTTDMKLVRSSFGTVWCDVLLQLTAITEGRVYYCGEHYAIRPDQRRACRNVLLRHVAVFRYNASSERHSYMYSRTKELAP